MPLIGRRRIRDPIPTSHRPPRWLLQEIKTRLPGRGLSGDVATLTDLLREAETRHGSYEATAPKHHWSDWYAPYIVARERGKSPEDAAKDATMRVDRAVERVRT